MNDILEKGAPLWPPEIDLGRLSPGERVMLDESEADRELRARMEAEYRAAHEQREFRESLVRRHLTHAEMQIVDDYAEAKAREIIARHKLETCGWGF